MTSKLDKWVRSTIASCIHKKRYKTGSIAEAVAAKVLKERGTKLYCYYCTQCGGYHLTSRLPKDKKESQERIF